MGNDAEEKSLLLRVLALLRKEGSDYHIGKTLLELSRANRMLGLIEEGVQKAKEALEIMERVGGTMDQARCLNALAFSLYNKGQHDAAQDAASRAINLLEKGQELETYRSHRILGEISSCKGNRKKAIHHFEAALGIASSFEWSSPIFWIHHSMAYMFLDEDQLDDAQAHITQAKLHTVDNAYLLGHAMEMQARIWYRQNRLGDATSEIVHAMENFGGLGAVTDLGNSRALLQLIEQVVKSRATSGELDSCADPASQRSASGQTAGSKTTSSDEGDGGRDSRPLYSPWGK